MGAIKRLFSAGETLVDRSLCVIGAVLFSQAPEFMQQYQQRLGGHLVEARRQLAQFEDIARQAGRSIQELVTQYLSNPDPSVSSMGKLIGDSQHRVETLAAAEAALRDASLWSRPFVFLRGLDAEIARGTANVFRPAVPTTAEGIVYALIGVLAILFAYHGLLRPLARRICRRPASESVEPKRV